MPVSTTSKTTPSRTRSTESLRARKAAANASYFAFMVTPKNKTLDVRPTGAQRRRRHELPAIPPHTINRRFRRASSSMSSPTTRRSAATTS
ncbi:hypothetical protein QJS66_21300 [Kocuria rhizophila]|nr:hypothetical protein QJS66_21300 [Kocuria rhizophila]